MKYKKICFINMLITASIGYFLIVRLEGKYDLRLLIPLLIIYPTSYYITALFLILNLESVTAGFVLGGIFSYIGTVITVCFVFFCLGESDFIRYALLLFSIPSFIVGAISGSVITMLLD